MEHITRNKKIEKKEEQKNCSMFHVPCFMRQKGIATLEMLIAMSLIIFTISAILPLVSGSQSTSVSSQTNQEALYKAQGVLENARATSRSDFASIKTSAISNDGFYNWQTVVDPALITQCGKDVKGHVTWNINSRLLEVGVTTHISDVASAIALGGNCDDNPPSIDGWSPPSTWASYKFSDSGQPTSLDAFNRIVYMTGDGNPQNAGNFYIADTNNVPQGTTDGEFIIFQNGFKSDRKLNDVKVARFSNGNVYAFVARQLDLSPPPPPPATPPPPLQFEVINVTDIYNPVSVAKRSLIDVGPGGSQPHGWRLFYYDNRVYVVTRFTAGPEFHVFDVSNPSSPTEIGSGTDLARTVESFVVAKKIISGTEHYFVYMATDKDSAPLSIFEVDPNTGVLTELTAAKPVFTGYQDGWTVFLVGNKLYFGRASDPSGSDLFVYDVSNPLSGLPIPLLAEANVGTSVIGVSVSGPYVFLVTTQAQKEFKVWHSDPNNFTAVCTTFNFPNIVENGIKYEDDWVYLASRGQDPLRILYDNGENTQNCSG